MKAFETLTVSNTVKALSSGIYSKNNGLECCNKATLLLEGANIRYRVDGGEPSTTVGLLAEDGDVIALIGRTELKLFRAIRTDSTDATLNCDYGVSNGDIQ